MKQDTKIDTLRTTPSVDNCKFDRKGYCKEHNYQAKKVTVSSKKWKDRGGGKGYGYVSQKVTKFICKREGVTAVSDATSTNNTEEGFVIFNAIKSRNLEELEQSAKLNSGDTEGTTNSGVSESYSGQADFTRD